MRVEEARREEDRIVVRTTGALYEFDLGLNQLSARQLLERERDVAQWRFSLSLAGMEILRQNDNECVLANDRVTIGVQCDSLVMIAPHQELILTLTSRIGGRWNRLACGHLIAIDDFGGMAVNLDIPLGSGQLPRCDAGVRPGRVVAGKLDFSGVSDNQTLPQPGPAGLAGEVVRQSRRADRPIGLPTPAISMETVVSQPLAAATSQHAAGEVPAKFRGG